MKKGMIHAVFAGFGVLLLILDSRSALSGAQAGIELCLCSVIPSLFPFIVLTGMLASVVSGGNFRFLHPLGKLLGIPRGREGLFLTGILGGYPTGALAVHQAWQSGQLKDHDARRMLAFCSNAGPAFLFGILGAKFPQTEMLWLLWGIHILSAILVGMLLPGKSHAEQSVPSATSLTLTQSVKSAVATMGYICGWIVLFRIVLVFCDRWFLWLLPQAARVGFYGFLELANGCLTIDTLASMGARFIISSGMLAFGGICVLMQTASVTGSLGLGLYLPGKLLQTLFSILLSWLVQWLLFPATEKVDLSPIMFLFLGLTVVIPVTITRNRKIRGSIPQLFGV